MNQHYTLFGQCDDASVEVVEAITHVQRDSQDKPLTPVVLKKVTIVREGQPVPAAAGAVTPEVEKPKYVNISAGVAQGFLEQNSTPIYPVDAKRAGVSGMVVLEAAIGADGRIENLKVISGPALLQQAALDAVRTWRYRPYLLNGQRIAVHTTINVIFTLAR